jgi:Spy/CpxP family protein refolding chaperone
MCKKMTAVLIGVLMSFTAGNAFAMMGGGKGMMGGRGGGMADHFMMMVDILDLNAEQQKAVETIHYAHRKEVIRKAADIDLAEVELQEITGKEPVNMADAEKKIRAIAALHADLDIMHLKAKVAVKAKLTPEQLEKMEKHMAAGMKYKMKDMGGMGMGCCQMACKSKNCAMLRGDFGVKASDADTGKAKEAEPSSHH